MNNYLDWKSPYFYQLGFSTLIVWVIIIFHECVNNFNINYSEWKSQESQVRALFNKNCGGVRQINVQCGDENINVELQVKMLSLSGACAC